MGRLFPTISLLVLSAGSAFAAPKITGEIKLQEEVLVSRAGDSLERVAGDTVSLSTATVRIKAEGQSGPWSYELHYLLTGNYADHFRKLEALTPAPVSRSLFDLEKEFARGARGNLDHRLDRMWIAHTTPKTVLRLGRQALTWGHGQVFHPLDLFNPFAPDAKDTSYKPGTDMAYAQYLFDDGSDVQFLAVPRRNAQGDLKGEESSFAVKGFHMFGSVETEVVAASDHGDSVFAVGATGPLGDALWKFDVVTTNPDDGGVRVSAVASLNHSWSWNDRAVTGFIEYYRNGFGVADRRSLVGLPEALVTRIARGQIFNTGRDYLAVGGTVQWTPLLQVMPTAVVNLNDGSALAITTANYSISNSVSLVGGVQFSIGERGTEFGGLPIYNGSSEYQRVPHTFFIRLEKYF